MKDVACDTTASGNIIRQSWEVIARSSRSHMLAGIWRYAENAKKNLGIGMKGAVIKREHTWGQVKNLQQSINNIIVRYYHIQWNKILPS